MDNFGRLPSPLFESVDPFDKPNVYNIPIPKNLPCLRWLILSEWSDILGNVINAVWRPLKVIPCSSDGSSDYSVDLYFPHETMKFISKHALAGSIPIDSNQCALFFQVKELSIESSRLYVVSFVFRGSKFSAFDGTESLVPTAISFLIRQSQNERIDEIHKGLSMSILFLIKCIQELQRSLQISSPIGRNLSQSFSSTLGRFISVWFQKYVHFPSFDGISNGRLNIEETLFGERYDGLFPLTFIGKMVSAFIASGGACIVKSVDSNIANVVLRTLTMFHGPHVYIKQDTRYDPPVKLQAVTRTITNEELVNAPFPRAIIDLDTKSVCMTGHSLAAFHRLRNKFLISEASNLVRSELVTFGSIYEKRFTSRTTGIKNISCNVKEASTIITLHLDTVRL